jgi:hypothetical protein
VQKRFNSAANPDEHRTTGLPDLQKNEVATQRNDRLIDSAYAPRVHHKEIARLGQQRVHLLRGLGGLPEELRQRGFGR